MVAVSIVGGFLATQAQMTGWLRPQVQGNPSLYTDGNAQIGDVVNNTGGLLQTRSGVILNTAGANYGLIVQGDATHGFVGIGTQTPAYKLDVAGDVNGTRLCINGNCQSSWPSGGPGSLPAGTSGQTLRHNGTDWVANSAIYNDGTNVGIGTTPGAYKLNVSGAMNATTLYQNGSLVQNQVTNTCVSGTAIRLISALGYVTCESTGGDGLGTGNTGTTGYIPKWTTNNTVLGNSIIQEGSGGIGIGASPVSATKLSAQGTNASDGGIAGYSSGVGIGVYGSSASGIGVRGNSTSGQGVYGSGSTQGVFGYSTGGQGVYGQSNTGWAGYFSGNVYSSGNISVAGNATLGDASSDTHTVNGSLSITTPSKVLMGYEMVSNSSTGSGHFDTDVWCSVGKVVLGGGCNNSVSDSTAISSSNPASTQNGWHCRTRDVVTATSRTVTAYAICARMGN